MNRQRMLMDSGWKFHLGDVSYAPYRGHDITYMASKSEHAKGPGRRDFDDSMWECVTLPHDYVVRQTPNASENEDHGCLPRENAWYRRIFKLDAEDINKRLTLVFDGVATACEVYINGERAARNYTGGIGFSVDFSDIARYGEDLNVVSVYVDNHDFEGWYYEGGGIYRHVWLIKADRISVDESSLFVHAQRDGKDNWTTFAEIPVRNDGKMNADVTIINRVFDGNDRLIGENEVTSTAAGKSVTTVKTEFNVKDPPLWSPDHPNLCTLRTEILADGEIKDSFDTVFGYRELRYDPDRGLFINGEHVLIKGMCNHQDYLSLGVGIDQNIQAYRVKRLKDMGCNAFRCAHNPHAPELYEECDRQGMLVMDETRWFESTNESLDELRAMVRRDRNHPCVIMYSLFNEEPLLEKQQGVRIMQTMRAEVKKLDTTRPATGAMFFGVGTPGAAEEFDIIGINYNLDSYDDTHARYPDKPIFASETACGPQNFGVLAWKTIAERAFCAGGFMWTGWAYRGESRWPRLFSRGGTINMMGQPNPGFWQYKAYFTNEPFVRITPHWNYEGHEGELIPLMVFTQGDHVEMTLNGRKIAESAVDPYEVTKINIPFEAGTLEAIAYKDGVEFARHSLKTSKKATALKLVRENEATADGESTLIYNAFAVDEEGNTVFDAENVRVSFAVDGSAKIICVGSNNGEDHESWQGNSVELFNGACQVLIRVSDREERIVVSAEAEGLKKAEAEYLVKQGKIRLSVPIVPNTYLGKWTLSPLLNVRPDIEEITSGFDTSAWQEVEPSRGSQMAFLNAFPRFGMIPVKQDEKEAYIMYHSETVVPAGGKPHLYFERVNGQTWVCLRGDGKQSITHKESVDPGTIYADATAFDAGTKLSVFVLIKGSDTFDSINRPVWWMLE